MQSKLTIGKVAKAAAINIETIRFYQRKGLIAEPPKALGGFRYYSEKCIEKLHFIKRAQAIGFTLEEIKDLLAMEACDACQQTHDASLIKLNMVNARITELERIRETLKELIGKCEKENYEATCPIIDSLHQN
ncbi:MAG: MerR family transcriptional regulator [Methylotenera sp.]|jgi:MerR family mercuric resistance operon transcriptional regulator|nr:MerR family transcriptional regulator [Methylotenera sp.]